MTHVQRISKLLFVDKSWSLFLDRDGVINDEKYLAYINTWDVSRKDLSFLQKMNYLFKPPGWSHDGTRLTSEELRIKESENFKRNM